jgi:hypothetical protein
MDISTKEGKIKLAIYLGLGIGVAYVGLKVYQKVTGRGKVLRKLGNKSILSKESKGNLQGKNTKVQFDPKFPAEQLYKAMKGWGTDENLIWNTLEPLNKEQRNSVKQYFDAYLGKGESLFQWFEDDLDGSELAKAKGYFN